MKEIISLHIGQSGIQFGNALWELYCLEHGLGPDGFRSETAGDIDEGDDSQRSIFEVTSKCKYIPRSIFIDSEPSVIDEVRTGTYGRFHHPQRMINDCQDAANNFARAKYTTGPKMIDQVMRAVGEAVNQCDQFQGFMLFHSLGGGTGSGFLSYLLQRLQDAYPKKYKIQMSIYPSPMYSAAVVEPYNAVLTAAETMETTDLSFMVDNESMYDILRRNLYSDRPTYSTINKVIAQVMSTVTAPDRFTGPLKADLQDFQTNLVPYPRIHFPLITYAPLQPIEVSRHEKNDVIDLTRQVFHAGSRMLQVDPRTGKYMAVSLIFRGDVNPKDVNTAINEQKESHLVNFVDWCPTGFKVGINSSPPTRVPGDLIKPCTRAVCMMTNNSCLVDCFATLTEKFRMMYRKSGFVYWYVSEGMEEGEMTEALENIESLEMDYRDLAGDTQGQQEVTTSRKQGEEAYKHMNTEPRSSKGDVSSRKSRTAI